MSTISTSAGVSRAGMSWPHLVPVVLLGWWTISASGSERPYLFIDGVNLAFHEAGHLIFAPFGSTLGILGGTLGQLLVAGPARRLLPAEAAEPFLRRHLLLVGG